ncbi:MAG: sigma-70 family RNA polymerase sigma factor [Clostridia bacterium]|nr:sigma-70 family RNA polymerase sigma factor [Clostridia bacterium]
MDDSRIIELYFSRDNCAINETKVKYGKLLYSVSYNILQTHEDAEECENDTYLAAWDQIPPTKPQVLSAFLSRIARNLSFKKLKANTAQKRGGSSKALPVDELANLIPDNTNAISELEITEILNAFLRELPTRDRQVFICHYWYCDSIKDISRQFGFTQSKVKMILLRTRQKLLDHLEKQEVFI